MISSQRNIANEKSLIIAQLAEVISNYEDSFPLNKKDYEIYRTSKEEFEELLNEKAQQIIFRSKVTWYEAGERCTKYFLNMEKIHGESKECKLLIRDDNTQATTLSEIMEEQIKFYQKLYSSDENIAFSI